MLFFAGNFGFALMKLGDKAQRLRRLIDDSGHAMFGVIGIDKFMSEARAITDICGNAVARSSFPGGRDGSTATR